MKKSLLALLILCLGFSLTTAHAEISTNTTTPAGKNYPGKEVAKTLSEITGVAISPLIECKRGGRVGLFSCADAGTKSQNCIGMPTQGFGCQHC